METFALATAENHIGEPLGVSDWVDIDQVQVNVFGEVTRCERPDIAILNTQRTYAMAVR